MSDPKFVQEIAAALRVLIDENVSNGPPMQLTCDYLAPRVAAAIEAGIDLCERATRNAEGVIFHGEGEAQEEALRALRGGGAP